MGMNDLTPDFEGDIKRAQANFRKITELKEKLEILTEHVQSRKEALEEEIEDWIKNAPDAKLVIIDPYVKVKKTIYLICSKT